MSCERAQGGIGGGDGGSAAWEILAAVRRRYSVVYAVRYSMFDGVWCTPRSRSRLLGNTMVDAPF